MTNRFFSCLYSALGFPLFIFFILQKCNNVIFLRDDIGSVVVSWWSITIFMRSNDSGGKEMEFLPSTKYFMYDHISLLQKTYHSRSHTIKKRPFQSLLVQCFLYFCAFCWCLHSLKWPPSVVLKCCLVS